MPHYAQIDGGGVVVAVTTTAQEVTEPHMIPLPEFTPELLGWVYEDGDFRAPE